MVWMVPEEPAGGVDVWKDNSPTSTMMMISALAALLIQPWKLAQKNFELEGVCRVHVEAKISMGEAPSVCQLVRQDRCWLILTGGDLHLMAGNVFFIGPCRAFKHLNYDQTSETSS